MALRSNRFHEPDFELAIEVFLVRLGERIDACQDAEARGDVLGLLHCAATIAEHGEALGFAVLVRATREIRKVCAERSPSAIRKAVEELTEVAQRIRRGHRSVP